MQDKFIPGQWYVYLDNICISLFLCCEFKNLNEWYSYSYSMLTSLSNNDYSEGESSVGYSEFSEESNRCQYSVPYTDAKFVYKYAKLKGITLR